MYRFYNFFYHNLFHKFIYPTFKKTLFLLFKEPEIILKNKIGLVENKVIINQNTNLNLVSYNNGHFYSKTDQLYRESWIPLTNQDLNINSYSNDQKIKKNLVKNPLDLMYNHPNSNYSNTNQTNIYNNNNIIDHTMINQQNVRKRKLHPSSDEELAASQQQIVSQQINNVVYNSNSIPAAYINNNTSAINNSNTPGYIGQTNSVSKPQNSVATSQELTNIDLPSLSMNCNMVQQSHLAKLANESDLSGQEINQNSSGENNNNMNSNSAIREISPFIQKLNKMIEQSGDPVNYPQYQTELKIQSPITGLEELKKFPLISWSDDGNSFVIRDPNEFTRVMIPSFFKSNKRESFIRQLNTYGFKKMTDIDGDNLNTNQTGNDEILKYFHRDFPRDRKDQWFKIKRRRKTVLGMHHGLHHSHSIISYHPETNAATLSAAGNLNPQLSDTIIDQLAKISSEHMELRQKILEISDDNEKLKQRNAELCQQNMINKENISLVTSLLFTNAQNGRVGLNLHLPAVAAANGQGSSSTNIVDNITGNPRLLPQIMPAPSPVINNIAVTSSTLPSVTATQPIITVPASPGNSSTFREVNSSVETSSDPEYTRLLQRKQQQTQHATSIQEQNNSAQNQPKIETGVPVLSSGITTSFPSESSTAANIQVIDWNSKNAPFVNSGVRVRFFDIYPNFIFL